MFPKERFAVNPKNLITMRKARVTTGFESLSDADFQLKSEKIFQSMVNNIFSPNPTPDMATLDAAVTSFSTALLAAQSRDKNAVAVKNAARATLTDLLNQLAGSVNTTANGDLVKLVSTGFDLAKDGESVPLPKPGSPLLSDGINQGELISKVPSVTGSKVYGHRYTTDAPVANTVWVEKISTSSKFMHTGLVSGQKYWCQVAAYGPFEQVVYSDSITRVVQ